MYNLQTGHRDALNPKAKFYEGDIRDAAILGKIFTENNIEAVIHFAANSLVGESVQKPLKYFNNNVYGMQVLLEATSNGAVDVAIADHWIWKENGSESVHRFFAKEFSTDSANLIRDVQRMVLYKGYSPFPSPSCSYMFSALWSKLIRRTLLVDNGIRFSGALKLYEDGLVALQVFEHAKTVAYKQVPVYHYRILNDSLCHVNEQRLVTDCANIVREIETFIQANGNDATLRDAFMARVLFLTKKMALRSFFCKGAQGSFLGRYKAFKGIFAAEPYCTAVKNAAKLKLCGNERTYGKLVGRGLFFATALMYELRTRIRR